VARIHSGIAIFPFVFLNNWPTSFAMLGFGFVAGRRNALTDPFLLQKIPLYFPYLSFMIGILGGLCSTFHDFFSLSKGMGMAIFAVTSPFISFFYVYCMIQLSKLDLLKSITNILGRNGRMSLTIYLSESVLMGILFQKWGLGLFDKLKVHELLLLSIPCYLSLSIFSYLWYLRLEMGPMEWLLRKFVKVLSTENS